MHWQDHDINRITVASERIANALERIANSNEQLLRVAAEQARNTTIVQKVGLEMIEAAVKQLGA